MELRLTGTPAETERTVHALRAVLDLHSVSPWYPNRGTTGVGRIYLDTAAPHLIPTAPPNPPPADAP